MPTCTEAFLVPTVDTLNAFDFDINVFLPSGHNEPLVADSNEQLNTDTDELLISENELLDEVFWEALYPVLIRHVSRLVHGARMPGWKRQERDIVEDIVQTAMEKMLKKLRQGAEVIKSIQAWSSIIARNCFLDFRRYELRRLHFSYDDAETEEYQQSLQNLLVDPTQDIESQIYEGWLMAASVGIIVALPPKRRNAILIDLANNSCFDGETTALQQAFLDVGICLQDYRCELSSDQAVRGRQSALCSLAYKDVAQARIS